MDRFESDVVADVLKINVILDDSVKEGVIWLFLRSINQWLKVIHDQSLFLIRIKAHVLFKNCLLHRLRRLSLFGDFLRWFLFNLSLRHLHLRLSVPLFLGFIFFFSVTDNFVNRRVDLYNELFKRLIILLRLIFHLFQDLWKIQVVLLSDFLLIFVKEYRSDVFLAHTFLFLTKL